MALVGPVSWSGRTANGVLRTFSPVVCQPMMTRAAVRRTFLACNTYIHVQLRLRVHVPASELVGQTLPSCRAQAQAIERQRVRQLGI
jgi:hypothetical protein